MVNKPIKKAINRPIKKWRSGNFEVAIWSNKSERNGEELEFKTLTLSRNWKKKDDDVWRSDIMNLRKMDIPRVMVLLQKAQEDLLLTKEVMESGRE